jgi:hypothetical protein
MPKRKALAAPLVWAIMVWIVPGHSISLIQIWSLGFATVVIWSPCGKSCCLEDGAGRTHQAWLDTTLSQQFERRYRSGLCLVYSRSLLEP